MEPTEDGVFFTDVPLNVSLQIGDTENTASNLEVSIQSSIDGDILAEWQITETGLANTDIQLSAGLHDLAFTVQDTGGEAVEDSVSIEVYHPINLRYVLLTHRVQSNGGNSERQYLSWV